MKRKLLDLSAWSSMFTFLSSGTRKRTRSTPRSGARTRRRIPGIGLFALILAAAIFSSASNLHAATPQFVAADLGTLGGTWSTAYAVNDKGQVVGTSTTASGASHAFSWTQAGGMIDLNPPGGVGSEAVAVNNNGQVIGYYTVAVGWTPHAFLWTKDGGMIDLGNLGGGYSVPTAINSSGQIVGYSYYIPNSGAIHAFSWTKDGGMIDLNPIGPNRWAWGVNDNGQVICSGSSGGAFLWTQADGMIDLAPVIGTGGFITAINSSGQIVGGRGHAFLLSTQTGEMIDLGDLGSSVSVATLVNNNGQVSGWSYTTNGREHPFLWTKDGGMIDLAPPEALQWCDPSGLNDSGQVVGSNRPDPNTFNAFSWTQASGMVFLPTLGGSGSHAAAVNAKGQVVGWSTTSEGLTHAVLWQASQPPVVNAGNNVLLRSKDQNVTTLTGTASDADGDPLTYNWLEGTTILATGQVGLDGRAPLDLGTLPQLSLGAHTLTLQVYDGYNTSQASMILTVENSAPTVAPSGEGTYQVNTWVTIGGQLADYDGDTLSYTWFDATATLSSGVVKTTVGGAPVNLPSFTTSDLKVGLHTITLQASDGVNAPVARSITVTIIDTIAPTLAPVASQMILWPPNHKMVPVTIQANATDNGGMPVQLAVAITCNESEKGVDYWRNPVIDQNTGIISLSLMADRFGDGTGRRYTISIAATDQSGNASIANVMILVPHDQGKK